MISFEDFVRFVFFEECKTSFPAIQAWFNTLDLDSDGYIRPFEIDQLFNIIQKRTINIENDMYYISDILCLLIDMFDLKKPIFTLNDIMKRPHYA